MVIAYGTDAQEQCWVEAGPGGSESRPIPPGRCSENVGKWVKGRNGKKPTI